MSPKKQQQSSFFFFMQDFRKREEAKGRKFPGGFKDVSVACGDEWAAMTAQQKGPYEARAKNAKVRNGLSYEKLASNGVPIALIEKEEKRKQDFEDTMNDYIKATVSTPHKDGLPSKKFYFIHVNWLCQQLLPNNQIDFIPIEFAVAEFSLRHGVQNTYHEIIDIDVPMGYASDALQHSEATHRIDKNPVGGQKNFLIMFQNLKAFLKPETIGEELPPLYTTGGAAEIVPGLLSRMAKSAGRSVDLFRIYSIETLFFHIRNAAAAGADGENSVLAFPTLSLAIAEIQKDRFDRAPGIACEYHTEMEESSVHCSRSIVVRWAYIICDFCCLDLDIEMLPGTHCPLNTDVDSIMISRENAVKQALIYARAESVRGLASMSGVTEEYRRKTSERTYKEEQERRQKCRPLEIIDYSKLRNSNEPQVKSEPKPTSSGASSYSNSVRPRQDQPLRAPRTQMRKSKVDAACPYSRTAPSYAMMRAEEVPDLGESNFPAIGGRGAGIRKKFENHFPPIGRGRGSPYAT